MEELLPLDPTAVLPEVARLPIQQRFFKAEPDEVKHAGRMAPDFRAAFGPGGPETAIHGLNQKVEEQKPKNAELQKRLAALEQRLSKLNLRRD